MIVPSPFSCTEKHDFCRHCARSHFPSNDHHGLERNRELERYDGSYRLVEMYYYRYHQPK
jgi:hypothetical protein